MQSQSMLLTFLILISLCGIPQVTMASSDSNYIAFGDVITDEHQTATAGIPHYFDVKTKQCQDIAQLRSVNVNPSISETVAVPSAHVKTDYDMFFSLIEKQTETLKSLNKELTQIKIRLKKLEEK